MLVGALKLIVKSSRRFVASSITDLGLLARLLVGLLADLVVLVHDCLDLLLGDHALADQLLAVNVHHVGVLLDDGVHDRLGEHRLVYLVVAESPAMADKGLKAVTGVSTWSLHAI